MSSTVERRIVQMVFEANEFRKGIRQSIDDLGALKRSFQMDEAQRSLSELEKATHVDFSPMSNALDSINNKMSIVGIAAAHMVTKITDSIVGAASKLADALIVAPIVTGLEEYEIQLNAIQTILANTAKHGTDLEDVSGALDELNTYADLTIYNFTQMVDSIGKFTTAGVDLETSTLAIKGIANIAAISGSSAQQASTAMYQLSQAIGTGSLKLQDWNSVVNAGMGGQIFQDALADTARTYGVNVDYILEKNGSFRASLQEGWISKEILLDTLAKFTGDLSDAELEALGYTEEQIAAIQEQATMAVDAATKIKTLTGLMDTLNEALQSGWAQSWKFIFGDFNEAQELWGEVSEFFSGFISSSSDARNELLTTWNRMGGRTEAIEALFNLLDAGANILEAFIEAVTDIFEPLSGFDLYYLTRSFNEWTFEIFNATEELGPFKSIVSGIAAIFSILFMVVGAVLKPFGVLTGITSGLGGGLVDMLAGAGDAIVAFRDMAEETGFFDTVVANIITHVKEFIAWVKDLVKQFNELQIVQRIIATILWAFEEIKKIDPAKVWEGFLNVLTAIVAPFYLAAKGAEWLYNEIVKLDVVQDIVEWFNDIDLNEIKQEFVELGDGIKEFIDEIKDSDIVKDFAEAFSSFDVKAEWEEFITAAKEGFGWIGTGSEKAREGISNLLPDMTQIKEAAKELGAALKEAFAGLWDYIFGEETDIDYDRLFQFINTGLAGGFILALRKLADMFSLDAIFGDSDIGDAIVEDLEGVQNALNGMALGLKAEALKNVALAIALLAGSIFLLSAIPSEKLAVATAAVGSMALALAGSTRVMGNLDLKSAAANALLMIGIAISLGLVAVAIKPVAEIDPIKLTTAVGALGGALVGMVTSVILITKLAGNEAKILTIIATMYGLSKALRSLSGTVEIMGQMDEDVLIQGGAAVGIILTALSGMAIAMGKWGSKDAQKLGLNMIGLAAGIFLLSFSIEKIGGMDLVTLATGLAAVGVIMLAFGGFSRLVKPKGMLEAAASIAVIAGSIFIMYEAIKKMATLGVVEYLKGMGAIAIALLIIAGITKVMGPQSLPAAGAIAIVAGAMVILAYALTELAKIRWQSLAKGLLVIGAFFVIIGVAGYLLAPVVPVLLALGIAIGLIGLAAFGFGLGIFLAAAGLVALAGSASAIAVALPIVADAIVEVLPRLVTAFAEAIVNFVTVLAEKGPELFEAFSTLITNMMESITSPEFLPKIVGFVLNFIVAIIDEFEKSGIVDKVIQAGWDILTSLIKGVEDNIQEVVDAGLGVIEEFIAGLESGVPPLLIQAKDMLMAFFTTIEEEIVTKENVERMTNMGLNIAGNIVAGVIAGIISGGKDIFHTLAGVISDAIHGAEGPEGSDSQSPSKKTTKIGKDLVDGFVKGIQDNAKYVDRAIVEFGQTIKRKLEPVVQQMATAIDKEATFKPVISPVLDLENFRRGKDQLSHMGIFGAAIMANVEHTQGTRGYASVPIGVAETVPSTGVNFIQNNYSPTALDRETIYRQTRTHLAKLEQERTFGL